MGDSENVRAVLDDVLDAQNAGDAGRYRAHLSRRPDAVHIGTDPDEWWTSDQVADSLGAEGEADVRAVTDDIGIHVLGDVAWAEGRGRFLNRGGGTRPVRLTCVLVREDGQWKLAHQHASIGVPNAEIFS